MPRQTAFDRDFRTLHGAKPRPKVDYPMERLAIGLAGLVVAIPLGLVLAAGVGMIILTIIGLIIGA